MGQIGKRLRALRGALAAVLALAGCGERNKYQPPPPAEVTVAKPEQRKVTLYMEVTGSTAPFNQVDLVARVQGFLEKVGYKDGATVKKGDMLFQIDKKDYEISLQIAEATAAAAGSAAAAGECRSRAQAGSGQDVGRIGRPAGRVARQARFDPSRAPAGQGPGRAGQAQSRVHDDPRALRRRRLRAPRRSRVHLSGVRLADEACHHRSGRSHLRELQCRRAASADHPREAAQQGLTLKDVGPVPIDVGLQTEKGYPHSGTLNYVAPEIRFQHRDAGGARRVRQQGARPVAGPFRARADPQAARRGVALGSRRRARQQPGGPLPPHRQRQERRRAAPGRGRRAGRRLAAHHQERESARRARGRRRPHARVARQHRRAGRPPAAGRRRARPADGANDRQVLHRPARSRQRDRAADRHPRHRRAYSSAGLAVSRRRPAHRRR